MENLNYFNIHYIQTKMKMIFSIAKITFMLKQNQKLLKVWFPFMPCWTCRNRWWKAWERSMRTNCWRHANFRTKNWKVCPAGGRSIAAMRRLMNAMKQNCPVIRILKQDSAAITVSIRIQAEPDDRGMLSILSAVGI